jgi:mRNA-degrading endonuclease toxin of MazEF toxin-antitoxin module
VCLQHTALVQIGVVADLRQGALRFRDPDSGDFLATEDTGVPVLTSLVCVLVTTKIRGHVAEVQIGQDEGLRQESVANCDNLFTLPKSILRPVGQLGQAKQVELDGALAIALGLR